MVEGEAREVESDTVAEGAVACTTTIKQVSIVHTNKVTRVTTHWQE
jgi:hypothetical protein